jgi:hypothetical protein
MVATAAVRLKTQIGPRGQQALIGLGGSSTIKNTPVTGSIYQSPGTLTFEGGKNQSPVSGIVDAVIVNKPDNVTKGEVPDPGPPTIDETKYAEYTNALNKAASYSVGTTNNVGGVSGTNYINIAGTYYPLSAIPAGSTWVINGAVEINSNSPTIGKGAKIVATTNVTAGNALTLEDDVQIFTKGNIALGNHAVSSGSGCALLAMGDISCDNHLNFKGIIFAGGQVMFATKLTLEGTLIAGDGFIIKNATVIYNPTVFDPDLIKYGNGNPVPQPGTWQWSEQ